jgi:hypothetical protein
MEPDLGGWGQWPHRLERILEDLGGSELGRQEVCRGDRVGVEVVQWGEISWEISPFGTHKQRNMP